jgi:hypothetical protein
MVDSALLEQFGFVEEQREVGMDVKGSTVFAPTGFPKPTRAYKAVHSIFNASIEENYFYVLEFLRTDQGFHKITKITDIFTASEHSAFFGNAQQRLGLQQDKVSQFLATIGKMVKELFQLVRELRILDERIGYYEDAWNTNSKSRESAEITLKGIWIDMVEQGSKNPSSVYGMSRELAFSTLPDLFFSLHPPTFREVDIEVDKLDFNRKVKEVLKRKLRTYLQWKDSTFDEVLNRRRFTLKYLRQHFDIIKMYMHWVKPYLKNIRRLHLKDMSDSPDLIAAFEGSLVEIEILAQKLPQNIKLGKDIISNEMVYSVALVHFSFRTSPTMSYHQEYQKGPIHVGKTDFTIRNYTWTQEQIDKYVQMKEKEDMALLINVDTSVRAAMEALGDELEKYLKQAGEEINIPFKTGDEIKKEKMKGKSSADPFISVVKGFGELFGALGGSSGKKGKNGKKKKRINKTAMHFEKLIAMKIGGACIYQAYKEYKKRNRLLHW